MLKLMIVDLGHDRGDGDMAGDAGGVECPDRRQPLAGLRRPRFERPGDSGVERSYREGDGDDAEFRRRLEQIEVAKDAV